MATTTKALIAAIGIGLAGFGTAQAQDMDMSKSRAEVAAETMQAAEQGLLDNYTEGATNVDPLAMTGAEKSRSEVASETAEAKASGELYQYGQAAPAAVDDEGVSMKSRDEVSDQAAHATRHQGLGQGQPDGQ